MAPSKRATKVRSIFAINRHWTTWAILWQKLPGKLLWLSRTEFEHVWSMRHAPRPEFSSQLFDVFVAQGGYWTWMAFSTVPRES